MNYDALDNLRRWWWRVVLFAAAIAVLILSLAYGSPIWAKQQLSQMPTAMPSDYDPTFSPGPPTSGFSGGDVVTDFLSRLGAGDMSYRTYLKGALFAFTPYGDSGLGQDARQADGSASISLTEGMNAAEWRSLEGDLTRDQTIVPNTLTITLVTADNRSSGRWSFDFTIRTTAGLTLRGDANGRGNRPDGEIDRLCYAGPA